MLDEIGKEAVEVAERYADSKVTATERERVENLAWWLADAKNYEVDSDWNAAWAAHSAVGEAPVETIAFVADEEREMHLKNLEFCLSNTLKEVADLMRDLMLEIRLRSLSSDEVDQPVLANVRERSRLRIKSALAPMQPTNLASIRSPRKTELSRNIIAAAVCWSTSYANGTWQPDSCGGLKQ